MSSVVLSTVVTKNHLREFLFLKFSAEHFHECSWYVYCDSYCYNYLKDFSNLNLFEADISDGKVFGTPEEKENFFQTILTKFDACEKALAENDHVLFVDSDIVFTNTICPLFDDFIASDLDIVASPHYQLNPQVDEDWGVFNVGFILIKSLEILNRWKEVTLTKEYLFEQKPLQVAIAEGGVKWDTFPITYNMGWWRFNNQKTQHRFESMDSQRGKISLAGIPIVSFHTHLFNLDVHPQCSQLSNFLLLAFSSIPTYDKFIKRYHEIKELEI